jgi:hypothetical protein
MTSFTLPNMETPTVFDHSIRFSVPPHQRSTFGLAIAGLPPAFLGFPTTGEAFESTAACKTRLQGFRLGKSNKDAFVEFLCIHHSAETRNDLQLEQYVERDPEGRTTGRRKRGDTRMKPNLDVNGDVKAKAGKVVSRGPPAPEADVDLTHVSDSESVA